LLVEGDGVHGLAVDLYLEVQVGADGFAAVADLGDWLTGLHGLAFGLGCRPPA
jgi:hypothetical protein